MHIAAPDLHRKPGKQIREVYQYQRLREDQTWRVARKAGRSVNRNTVIALAVIAVLGLAGAGGWYLAGQQENPAAPAEKVIVAYSPFESTALFWIAEDRHFFEQNGINISLRKYDSGAGSLDGVEKGDADIAVGVSEFPLVHKAFGNTGIRAIAVIDQGDFTRIVARRDRGIANISDLKGRRVGTTLGTVAEFHLGRFLTLHGMKKEDIVLVDIRDPPGWVNEVADGNIDAIATAQPYANAARDRLGDNAIIWPVQSGQPIYALAVSTDSWITRNPETVKRFLQSLSQAEEFANGHPVEAKEIVQKRLGLKTGYMDTVWEQNQFSLSLEQSLITTMEDQARWMIAGNMTNATTVPDFRASIYAGGLESVRPGSVHIIR